MIHVVDHSKPMTGKLLWESGNFMRIRWANGHVIQYKKEHLPKKIKFYDKGKEVKIQGVH
jgi:hypothetical protein